MPYYVIDDVGIWEAADVPDLPVWLRIVERPDGSWETFVNDAKVGGGVSLPWQQESVWDRISGRSCLDASAGRPDGHRRPEW